MPDASQALGHSPHTLTTVPDLIRPLRTRPAAAIGAALGAGAAALAVRAAWLEPRRLAVERVELRLPNWPEPLDGMTVAVAADLHVGAPHVNLARVIQRLGRLDAHVIAILGDFVTEPMPFARHVDREAIASSISKLRAPLGVFAVLGNSDDRAIRRALEATTAIDLLDDDVRERWWHGQQLWIAGFADIRSGAPDVEGVLARATGDGPILALTHSPDLFPRMPARVALTLAGHTHAGQVRIPGVTKHVVPSWFGDRYREGHVTEQGRHLFVHAGIGTSTLPIRFRAVPRVTLLTLRPA
jgi:predicted MPP superfamily phosphohydrolase